MIELTSTLSPPTLWTMSAKTVVVVTTGIAFPLEPDGAVGLPPPPLEQPASRAIATMAAIVDSLVPACRRLISGLTNGRDRPGKARIGFRPLFARRAGSDGRARTARAD